MPVISIVGTKGGTGKSTTAMGVAIWASQFLKREWILLIDGDIHIRTIGLKMCPVTDVTLNEVMEGKNKVEEAIYLCQLEIKGRPLYPNLAVLPAGGRFLPSMRGDPIQFLNYTKRKFDQIMKRLRNQFSYIIIDTPASMSFEHLILTAVADGLVYVAEPNEDSIRATLETAKGLKEFINATPVGVVVNRMPPDGSGEKWIKRAEQIAPLLGVIPEDEEVSQTFSADLPVVAANPSSPASVALREITERLLKIKIGKSKPLAEKLQLAIEKTAEGH